MVHWVPPAFPSHIPSASLAYTLSLLPLLVSSTPVFLISFILLLNADPLGPGVKLPLLSFLILSRSASSASLAACIKLLAGVCLGLNPPAVILAKAAFGLGVACMGEYTDGADEANRLFLGVSGCLMGIVDE
jgi:hypothetical protein